jgi:hypothetical protein
VVLAINSPLTSLLSSPSHSRAITSFLCIIETRQSDSSAYSSQIELCSYARLCSCSLGVVLVHLCAFYSSLLLSFGVPTPINLCMVQETLIIEILVRRKYKEEPWPKVDHWITWEGLSATLVIWDTTMWSRQAFEAWPNHKKNCMRLVCLIFCNLLLGKLHFYPCSWLTPFYPHFWTLQHHCCFLNETSVCPYSVIST